MKNLLNYIPFYGVWRVCKNDFELLPKSDSIHYYLTALINGIYLAAALLIEYTLLLR